MIEKLPTDIVRLHKGVSFVGVTTCFFCNDGKGNIFMAKRSAQSRDEQGRWDVGAGGLKWGVTAEENVHREVREEYGATPKSVTFIGYRDVLRTLGDGTQTHWLALDFLVEVNADEVRITEPEMFDDSGWFTYDTVPSPLHSQVRFALDKYRTALWPEG